MGKIIALEGLDKSGKQSGLKFIENLLISKGYTVATISFPRYETEIGKLIRLYLTNKLELTKEAFELLQAADKADFQNQLRRLVSTYDYVIIDRYTYSQFAYGGVLFDTDFLSEINKYTISPDVVIYFDVDVKVSMSRRGEHGDNDRYESDLIFLLNVKKNYKDILENKWLTMETNVYSVNANNSLAEVNIELSKIIHSIIES